MEKARCTLYEAAVSKDHCNNHSSASKKGNYNVDEVHKLHCDEEEGREESIDIGEMDRGFASIGKLKL